MAEAATAQPTLKRSLRFRDLTLFYIVTILSIRWVATAAAAGPGTLVVWVLALLGLFIPLAASVLALAARFPDEGGLYVWTREALMKYLADPDDVVPGTAMQLPQPLSADERRDVVDYLEKAAKP